MTAVDSQGKPVPSYNGTVHFSSSDGSTGVALPPDSPLPNGQGSFSVTLIKAGAQTVTASDTLNGSITGTSTIQVTAAIAASMSIVAPATAVAFQPVNVTVTVMDRFGNLASGYAGTVHFSSNDGLASLPADYTFTAANAGTQTFSVTFVTPSTQILPTYVTATDSVNGSLTATSQGTAVGAVVPPPPLLTGLP
jgi:hypothetical protein